MKSLLLLAAFAAPHTSGSVQHPHVIEHDGHLRIPCSRGKCSLEGVRVAPDERERLHHSEP